MSVVLARGRMIRKAPTRMRAMPNILSTEFAATTPATAMITPIASTNIRGPDIDGYMALCLKTLFMAVWRLLITS